MHRTSIVDHQTRTRERLANLATEARHHATGDEAATIDRLVEAVRLGYVTPRSAQIALAALRAGQRRRTAA